jgi:hypothetical protein
VAPRNRLWANFDGPIVTLPPICSTIGANSCFRNPHECGPRDHGQKLVRKNGHGLFDKIKLSVKTWGSFRVRDEWVKDLHKNLQLPLLFLLLTNMSKV